MVGIGKWSVDREARWTYVMALFSGAMFDGGGPMVGHDDFLAVGVSANEVMV